jgi:predicted ribosome quality control (RQC) complex YloA/Tae2 family protein
MRRRPQSTDNVRLQWLVVENFALITLVEELKEAARGMVVRRVVQHRANGFVLQTRSVRMPGLKICLDPRNPILYVSDSRPPVDKTTGDFLMVLRKHLVSAKLIEIQKPLSERIVELCFKTTLPTRELETVTLVVELFPNAPNLFLLDHQRNILACWNTPSSQREVAVYDEYRYPTTTKVDLAAVDAAEDWFKEEEFNQDKRGWLIRNLAGVGPLLAAELVHRHGKSGRPLPEELKSLLAKLTSPVTTVWLYSKTPMGFLLEQNDLDGLRRAVLSPVELESLGSTHGANTHPRMLEAVGSFYDALEERTLLEQLKTPRLRKLRDQKRRLVGQRKRLDKRRQQFEDAAGLQETAQMLVSSGVELDQRRESVEATDYRGEVPTPRTVELDPTRTIRENVNVMFKKHRKAGRGMKMLEQQFLQLDEAEARLARQVERIRSLADWNAWDAFARNPASSKSKGNGRGPQPASSAAGARTRGRRSVLLDDHEVLIGRNSRENDEITFRVASGDDFWLHVADYSGSHVIVRNPSRESELDPTLLERAAQLAAYHSQARNSHKVHVHYTQRKFVKKPRRSKPGLVLVREFKTITVEPRNWASTES